MKRLPPEVEDALARAGAVLARQKRHLVFRLRNGRMLTLPASPSDHKRFAQNAVATIERVAALPPGEERRRS